MKLTTEILRGNDGTYCFIIASAGTKLAEFWSMFEESEKDFLKRINPYIGSTIQAIYSTNL